MFIEYRVTKGVRGLLTIEPQRMQDVEKRLSSFLQRDRTLIKTKKTVRIAAYAQRSMVPEKSCLPSVREQLVHIHLVENNEMQVISWYIPFMAT